MRLLQIAPLTHLLYNILGTIYNIAQFSLHSSEMVLETYTFIVDMLRVLSLVPKHS